MHLYHSMTQFILAQGQGGGGGQFMITLVLMMVMFYFLLIRPQRKQRKELEERINSMKKGDKVVTIGGMHATVHHISKETVTLEPSKQVFITFNKTSVATVTKVGKDDKKAIDEPVEAEVVKD